MDAFNGPSYSQLNRYLDDNLDDDDAFEISEEEYDDFESEDEMEGESERERALNSTQGSQPSTTKELQKLATLDEKLYLEYIVEETGNRRFCRISMKIPLLVQKSQRESIGSEILLGKGGAEEIRAPSTSLLLAHAQKLYTKFIQDVYVNAFDRRLSILQKIQKLLSVAFDVHMKKEARVAKEIDEVDLNKVSEDALKSAKAEMEKDFLANQKRPGDEDYTYDVREDFVADPEESNDWDSVSEDLNPFDTKTDKNDPSATPSKPQTAGNYSTADSPADEEYDDEEFFDENDGDDLW